MTPAANILAQGSLDWWACLGGLAAAAGWVAAHRFSWKVRQGSPSRQLPMLAGRMAVGIVTLLLAFSCVGAMLRLTTSWPIGVLAVLGSASVETIVWLYRLERKTVSKRAGRGLTSLRIALALLLLLMLAQPVRRWQLRREDIRYVALLIDDSGSMQIADNRLSVAEKLRLARLFDLQIPDRPYRLDQAAQTLQAARGQLAALAGQLEQAARLSAAQRAEWLRGRRTDLHETLRQLTEQIDRVAATVSDAAAQEDLPLAGSDRRALTDLASRLKSSVRDAVERAARRTAADRQPQLGSQADALAADVDAAMGSLAPLAEKTETLGRSLDAAYFASLAPEMRRRVDRISEKTRAAIARAALDRQVTVDDEQAGLIQALNRRYRLQIYRFSDQARQVDLAQDAQPVGGGRTDLTGAIGRVLSDLPAGKLSGMIILSDGRSTSAEPIEPVARQLALADVPAVGVLIGSARAPLDAAIVSVESPDVVAPSDRISITAGLSADGLAGKKLQLRLLRDGETIDQRELKIDSDAFSRKVTMSHQNDTQGLAEYRLEIDSFDGEVLAGNNARTVPVMVRSDQSPLLLIESRPRWEFRYLKNLFADRDETVKLQYVLLQPDFIAVDDKTSTAEQRPVPASATAPDDRVEAYALPGELTDAMSPQQRAEEIRRQWLKFDTVILGDVDPLSFRREDIEALEALVTRRGGTLIVIAGPLHMPHHWTETALVDLLPARARTAEQIRDLLAEKDENFDRDKPLDIRPPESGFVMQLTAEGQAHPVTRQEDSRDDNRQAWSQFPPVYWRHPYLQAKPGARVLLYAQPREAGDLPDPVARSETPASDADRLAAARRQEQFEADHPLVVVQNVGHGRVMLLGFDRTWRMRYRIGDRPHHKFWGQVMRWAHGDRLPAGSQTVRLGTDLPRYRPDQPVRIKARLLDARFEPLTGASVQAKILDDESRLVRQIELSYLDDSPGLYTGQAAPLPAGSYRVELAGAEVTDLLAADEEYTDKTVATPLAVIDDQSDEQNDLSADASVLNLLASATSGRVLGAESIGEAMELLGPASQVHVELHDWRLWDSWPLLVIFLALAGAEWLTRKKVGLP